MKAPFFSLVLMLLHSLAAHAQTSSIQLNQIGFYPQGPKIAVINQPISSRSFYLIGVAPGDTLYRGVLSTERANLLSGKRTQIADFSSFQKPGKYQLVLANGSRSYPFEIKPAVHQLLAVGVLRGFYYQRMSTALPTAFAGKWARPFAHPDTKVLVHPSAASAERPAGFEIAAPGGWYDAGDYNKYVVNSGITTSTLLSLYEDFPDYCRSLKTNIPENSNQLPDLLDEILWNLRWMLSMQDPNDGGVYHKLTNADFGPMDIMPHLAVKPRYVVQKTTAAALNLAAVAAQAARVFRPFQQQLPGLADSCLRVARKAWAWAEQNPKILYEQNELNQSYDPDITTGAYDDRQVDDERTWAATELYLSTQENQYLTQIQFKSDLMVPTWNQVAALGAYALLRMKKPAAGAGIPLREHAVLQIQKLADDLLQDLDSRPYQTVMGKTAKDFVWGSSAVAANQAIVLLQAYHTFKKPAYLQGALHNLDYLLGRNATGYSFVTGFGSKYPLHIHHRLSESDGVVEPVPGLLSGGPNPGKQDKCPGYPSDAPDESYVDDACSYASNEIAINWNAPMVYLAVAIEALVQQNALKKKK